MKFIVNKLPKSQKECIFSTWEPNPPFIKEPGQYICTKCRRECNLKTNSIECHMLMEDIK